MRMPPKSGVPARVIKNVFVHEQYMSDEASGPEDNDETNTAVWKTRMAMKRGYEHDTDKEFLEVLTCNWRSDEMTDALHEMQRIAFDLLTPPQRKKIHYERVRGTGRESERVPERAPYNFGINKAWFDKYKNSEEYATALEDWGQYPDPDGLGTSQQVSEGTGEGDVEGGIPFDVAAED
ncbi:hypothetical protein MSAN_01976100 [Mycena sanguinolenta]|uniref:Uncharacterized protein n=1 Tax=Mycena sanguinolenta TaxID=230812 RepID=A0A8H7CPI4_9AGAR|nr:hypothetical protein MSAN_01976100 [Mycena sanguinolenta]